MPTQMIIQKIQQFAAETPDKQAIVYQGDLISYAQLLEKITERAIQISEIKEPNLLLNDTQTIENLINFLAAIFVGKAGIFVGKHLNNSTLQELKINCEAAVANEFFAKSNAISQTILVNIQPQTYKPTTKFLGILSSGTTGQPMLIWKDYQSWITAFPHQSEVFGIQNTDKLFVLDALAYSANLNAVLHMLWLGGTVVFGSLAKAKNWSELIEKEDVTSIFMVPSHLRLLVKNLAKNQTLRSVVSAGEKLDAETAKKILNFAPNALLTEYYGSAELGHITYHQNKEIIQNPLSVGKPFPEVKISFQNEQIFVESPYISPDFRNLKTNFDLGYFIDNQLILMGRAGRMFNRRGLNVFAEEIENTVKKLPYIIEATAVGILQEDLSHDILLAYTSKGGFKNNHYNQQIFKHLATHLQATKIPSRIQEFENLPRTDFGKIDYKALARIFEEECLEV